MKSISEAKSSIWLASEEERDPALFPQLYNLSAAFFYRFLPRPDEVAKPEFLYLPLQKRSKRRLELTAIMGEWNLAWESAQLRSETIAHRKEWKSIRDDFLPDLSSLRDRNVYLLPDTEKRFDAYLPLYAMLPLQVLEKFGLPPVRRMLWPTISPIHSWEMEPLLPPNFRERLSRAFATYVWPLIDGGSLLQAFNQDESLSLLAHNLDFWLPHAVRVAEERLTAFEFVEFEDEKTRQDLARIRAEIPAGEAVTVDRCRMGGTIWLGEVEAREAAAEMIESADRNDRLRSLIDAIRSNRVEEDFSERWSFAREDFERKLYRKRSRIRVKFVELSEADAIVGPQSEISDRLIWQDFFALLDTKEREVVVCLTKAGTNLTEAARMLGYANHTPVSKALTRIRKKAQWLLYGD